MIREPVWFIYGHPRSGNVSELLENYATNITKYYPPSETKGNGRWTLVHTTNNYTTDYYRFVRYLEKELTHFPSVELSKQLAQDNCSFGASLDIRMVNSSDWSIRGKMEAPVDFSKKGACQAYQRMLGDLFARTELSVGYFDSTYEIKRWIHLIEDPVVRARPNQYWTTMLECVAQLAHSKTSLISKVAFKSQHLPIWSEIYYYKYLTTVLSLSMAGYSWLISPIPTYIQGESVEKKQELFVRYMQAHTLMPVLSFYAEGNLDDEYRGSLPLNTTAETRAIISKLMALHNEHVDLFVELAKRRVRDGSPIIRPMWYEAPDDARTYAIADQYMLGENIVVAPVMEVGKRERQVYLPSGTWIDQHGRSFDGPGEFLVAAPLEELPYFKKKI